eukprot:403337742
MYVKHFDNNDQLELRYFNKNLFISRYDKKSKETESKNIYWFGNNLTELIISDMKIYQNTQRNQSEDNDQYYKQEDLLQNNNIYDDQNTPFLQILTQGGYIFKINLDYLFSSGQEQKYEDDLEKYLLMKEGKYNQSSTSKLFGLIGGAFKSTIGLSSGIRLYL